MAVETLAGGVQGGVAGRNRGKKGQRSDVILFS